MLKRKFTQNNINRLNNDLLSENWNSVFSCFNPDIAYGLFENKFNTYFDTNFPKEEITIVNGKSKHPWITRGILKSIKKTE